MSIYVSVCGELTYETEERLMEVLKECDWIKKEGREYVWNSDDNRIGADDIGGLPIVEIDRRTLRIPGFSYRKLTGYFDFVQALVHRNTSQKMKDRKQGH